MRKSELFARFRKVCEEVRQRNKLRRMFDGMNLLSDSEIIEVCTRRDFPGEGWSSTGEVRWVSICAHHRATAKDFMRVFGEFWKVREEFMQLRAEQDALQV